MAKAKVFNVKGEKVKEIDLADAVFSLKRNDDLIHQVFVALSANERQVLAHTKTRGERAGSGIKPWKQKGTGRARVGSVRTPVWRKGGVVFGPRKDRNFKQKINKKSNDRAIAMTLSGKLKDEEIIIIDKLENKSGKTKEMAKMIKNLKLSGKILMAFENEEKKQIVSTRNIENVKNIFTDQLNVLDMLNNKYLLLSEESIKKLEEKYKRKLIKENK